MHKHDGKVALVTGASSGMGQEFAKQLATEGADLVLASRHPATETEQMVKDAGGKVVTQTCDVTSPEDIQSLAEAVKSQFGRCDILINNAGIYPFQSFVEMSFEDWRKILSVDLDALFLTCKAFVPMMKQHNWGRIINISSNVCWMVAPNVTHYTAAKMGVIGFTRALATEVADAGNSSHRRTRRCRWSSFLLDVVATTTDYDKRTLAKRQRLVNDPAQRV